VEAAKADLEWTNNHKEEILRWIQNELDGSGNIATNKFAFSIDLGKKEQ
jgi:hypothetical protein